MNSALPDLAPSKPRLTEADWSRIETFIGYGRADAPVVFIGMEEGRAAGSNLGEDLLGRAQSQSIASLGRHERTQRTWRPMCDLMLRRSGIASPTAEQRLVYQKARLGRPSGETLLTELMPYPSTRIADWPYAAEPYLRGTRPEYMARCLPERIELLKGVLALAERELVICYGKGHWGHFARLFDCELTANGAYRIGRVGPTTVALVPHFCSRAFNSDGQMAALAEVASLRT
jgi:hypothetical protein